MSRRLLLLLSLFGAIVAISPLSQPRLPQSWKPVWTLSPRGPDWMPITPKTGSLFHADSQLADDPHSNPFAKGSPSWSLSFRNVHHPARRAFYCFHRHITPSFPEPVDGRLQAQALGPGCATANTAPCWFTGMSQGLLLLFGPPYWVL